MGKASEMYPIRDEETVSLDEIAAEVIEWGISTFGEVNPDGLAQHLKREAGELADNPDSEEEMADVFILAVQIAHHKGVDLARAVANKLAKIRTRTWNEPDEDGVIEHVREDDPVHHPAHYGGKDDPYEAIKVIEAWGLGFNAGNVIKYLRRYHYKGQPLTDLHKARFYLDRLIAQTENGDGDE